MIGCNKYFLLTIIFGSVFVPLWWVMGNFIYYFSLEYIFFANLIGFTVALVELFLIYILKLTNNFFRRKISSISFDLLLLTLLAFNYFTFGMCAIDLRVRYSMAASFVLGLLTTLMLKRKKYFKFMVAFSIIFVFVSVLNGLHNEYQNTNSNYQAKDNIIDNIDANHNIYILVFDSFVSEKAIKEIYNLNNLPWERYFKESGFRLIRDSVSAGDNTFTSFGTLYNFGNYNSTLSMLGANNSVYNFFGKNGYFISLLSDSGYFGVSPAPNLDFLYPKSNLESLCTFSPRYFLLNICSFFAVENALLDGSVDHNSLIEAFDNHLKERDKTKKWLTTVYTWYPGHRLSESVSNDIADNKWSSQFVSKSFTTVDIIDGFLFSIFKNDPNPIIIIFGDHGSWSFRAHKNEVPHKIPTRLIDLDTYGVSFAVYPYFFCKEKFSNDYNLNHLFRDIISCLRN